MPFPASETSQLEPLNQEAQHQKEDGRKRRVRVQVVITIRVTPSVGGHVTVGPDSTYMYCAVAGEAGVRVASAVIVGWNPDGDYGVEVHYRFRGGGSCSRDLIARSVSHHLICFLTGFLFHLAPLLAVILYTRRRRDDWRRRSVRLH